MTTVAAAQKAFFALHGLELAAHRARRLHVQVGPVRIPFPNPGWLPLHDLHHVALNVPPTFWGEVEISAFELRSGPRTALIAFLCVGALLLGTCVRPRQVMRAWRRYAGMRNLYREQYAELLTLELDELRRWMSFRSGRWKVVGNGR